jgi:hypothetical protein
MIRSKKKPRVDFQILTQVFIGSRAGGEGPLKRKADALPRSSQPLVSLTLWRRKQTSIAIVRSLAVCAARDDGLLLPHVPPNLATHNSISTPGVGTITSDPGNSPVRAARVHSTPGTSP